MPGVGGFDGSDLEPRLRRRVERALEADDRVLWIGRPDVWMEVAWKGGWYCVVGGALLVIFGVAEVALSLSPFDVYRPTWLGPTSGIGVGWWMAGFGALLILLRGEPLLSRNRFAAYVVTDRRMLFVFWCYGMWLKQAWRPSDLSGLERWDRGAPPRGALVVDVQTTTTTFPKRVTTTVAYGFLHLRDADEPERLIREHLLGETGGGAAAGGAADTNQRWTAADGARGLR